MSGAISNRTVIVAVGLAVFVISFLVFAPAADGMGFRLGYATGQGLIAALVTWAILRFLLKRR